MTVFRALVLCSLLLTATTVCLGQAPQIPIPQGQLPPGLEQLIREILARNPLNGYLPGSTLPGGLGPTMWGDLFPAVAGDPVATAREFLTKLGPLFGIAADPGVLGDLSRLGEVVRDGGRIISLTPKVDGIPYLAGQLNLQFSPDGVLRGVMGQYRKPENVKKGSLDATQAVHRAIEELARKYPDAPMSGGGDLSEFLAHNSSGQIEHLYQMDLIMGVPPRQKRVLLDSAGNLLSEEESGLSAIPEAKVYYGYPGAAVGWADLVWLSQTYDIYSEYPMPGWKLKSAYLDDAYHYYIIDYDGHLEADPYMYGGAPNDEFMAANCYHHLSVAMRWAWSWGMPYWPQKPLKFNVSETAVDGKLFSDNAMFFRDFSISYARYNPTHPTSPAMDASVSYHEFGHALHYTLNCYFDADAWGPAVKAESRAVSEGIGDAWSALMTGNPTVGAIYRKSGSAAPMRAWAVPPASQFVYQQVSPCYEGLETQPPPGLTWTHESHVAGQLLASALWEMQNGIGRDVTGRLLIRAMHWAVTPAPSTFPRFAQGLVKADYELNGGRNVAFISGVFRRKGIPGF